ncbi:glycoprotein precursor [Hazara virus]|uniref:Envelopment polyprotein n=1 Tax=Hazara virus (isolate JC280) TaxID=11597 RepID=GP_HAZVJ|nr:glycoprotein precursor [Hazara virus]A6XIP3.1 RecName: Full=Envelopment polyprotein; AltName: Full=M polyprotein; Contains: RecName: Full=GP38; Contains: RecName: Full=Glycoprotein N; Short=Gn; AltName: Full=Glycoprotein G2; Contains: RecName: Full=Non-Structural protein M; Short=NSm; Contains: RecName: Full=Glycoprotein C; Short=Gc; AltName: Full=Glycoprotein G1; Flags: Precursor [Hazara virus (isolate JC280)]ABH07417.1 glycoprotein precursor [Hazara virus]AJW66842.1 glycoprotein precursor [
MEGSYWWLSLLALLAWGANGESTSPAETSPAPTTPNPPVVNPSLRRKIVNQRILSAMGMDSDPSNEALNGVCQSIHSNGCNANELKLRLADFFIDTNSSQCYDEILVKKPCSSLTPAHNSHWVPRGLDKSEVDKIFDTKLKLFFSQSRKVTCLSASALNPSQFVKHFQVKIQETSGPAKQSLRSLHCVNLVWSHSHKGEKEVVHVLQSAVPVKLKNCLAMLNFRQCYYNQQSEGPVVVPSYQHNGEKWVTGAYTMTVEVDKHADGPCEISTTCITEGSEIKPGVHSLRGFKTTLVIHGKRNTGRRLLSSSNARQECSSGTFLGEGGSAQVVGPKNDGPGDHITFCNGSVVTKIRLGQEHGCYTVRRIKTYRNCRPEEGSSACEVDDELKPCGAQKCMNVHLSVKGLVKTSRGSNVQVHSCDKDCLIQIPEGFGDIQIDCPGGTQHYLESNVLDVDCPMYNRLGGLMLYFCRMSHRPRTCLALFIWLGAGYGITCIAGYMVYYAILALSMLTRCLKRKYMVKGDFCLKCEQKCVTSLDQTLHDESCSYNICPYCGNRLPEEGLRRHVPSCPKRKQRLEEIDLYLDYLLVPCPLHFALSTAVKLGTLLKRLSWVTVFLCLFLTAIAPVQGQVTTSPVLPSNQSTECTLLPPPVFLIFSAVLMSKTLKRMGPVNKVGAAGHSARRTNSPKNLYKSKQIANTKSGPREPRRRVVVKALLILTASSALQSIHLAQAFDSGSLPEGAWEEEMQLVQGCNQECSLEEDECSCPDGQSMTRKLLFFKGLNSAASKMASSHRLLTSVSIDTPWGAIKVESTYKPRLASSNIQLAWNSIEEQGDKVILSGKSTSIIKLEEKTGMQWSLGSESAAEEKRLLVSILDYTQVYSSTFQYITGDRTVSEWPKATCTGDCPDRCGCSTSSCLYKSWPHSRNWRCNPTWCWGVGTGCTCCGVDILRPFNKYFVTKWTTEYVRTDVLVCVELTDQERHCDVVEAGSQFVIGPVRVVVSDPQNVQTKLPSEILTIQKLEGNQVVDIMHATSIVSAKNACKLQSCTHGSPGDMQILHTDNLIQHSHDGGLNLADLNPLVNSTWMSWEGCDLDYYCTTGSWPSCTYTGINSENTESFDNLLNTESNLCERFHFHSKRISASGSTLQMDLKGRPNSGGGELSVLVDVKGLELHSKKISLKGLSFKTLSCSGCYACSSGLSCTVEVRIERPDEFTVHLRSVSPDIAVAEGSIIARRMTGGPLSRLRAFAVRKVKKICFEIVEKSYCKDCKNEDTTKCIEVELQPPKDILLEHKGTIIKRQNETCVSGLQCWTESASSFVSGVGSFFRNYLGSITLGIVLTLLPVAVVLLFFCYGDKLFKLCSCFRCCRGLSRGKVRKELDEDELRNKLKKFSKEGELFGKEKKDARTIALLLSGKGKNYKELV